MQKSSAASRIQGNIPELFKGQLAPGDAYIKFQLTSEISALLSMEQVQKSSIVEAEQITSLPSMPKSTVGMMNSKDRVFCVFDLAQILKLPSLSASPRQYQIVVLQTTNEPQIHIGFAVNQLQGILRLSTEQIQSNFNSVSFDFSEYVCGVVEQESDILPILKFDLIFEALTKLA